MRCFDDGPTVLTDSIFTLEVRAGNLNGGKWFLSGLPPMTRKAAESMKRQYADSKMWDGVRVTEWVSKEDVVEQTAANTVKTEEKQENTVKNSEKTMDNTIIALLALSVATLLHGAARHFLSKGGSGKEWFPKELGEAVRKGRKALETDETAKRGHDDAPTEANGRFKRLPRGWRTRRRPSAQASEQSHGEEPEDAKRFNTLAQMYKFLVHGRPCRRTMGKFNREYDEVVGSMTDEGWDHVLNNGPFKDIARDWRENGKPEIALALDRAECQDCGKTTKSHPSNQ